MEQEKAIRALSLPPESVFLLGPRGTGKSTFLKQIHPDAHLIDLLLPDNFRNYSARPERLLESLTSVEGTVIIDEIQRVPELLPVVHHLIESKRSLRFILTGSSARKLRKQGINLLGGRAQLRHMHPFIASELGPRFSLPQALETGLIPLIVTGEDHAGALAAYIDLYLREEVRQEGLTRSIGNFTRFLESASFSHASTLSVSAVARECQVERKTVEAYFGILEDLLLAFWLPVFRLRAKRAMAQHRKFYFFDTGVFRALRPAGVLDRRSDIAGAALEGLAAQHLRAWLDYTGAGDLHYWRTASGNEVDFVVYGRNAFWALEIKSTKEIHPRDLNGLTAFGEDYPAARRTVVYGGRERLERKGIEFMPLEQFFLTGMETLKTMNSGR